MTDSRNCDGCGYPGGPCGDPVCKTHRERSAAPLSGEVPLTDLCIIHGCLCRRVGANLCPAHQHPDLPEEEERCH